MSWWQHFLIMQETNSFILILIALQLYGGTELSQVVINIFFRAFYTVALHSPIAQNRLRCYGNLLWHVKQLLRVEQTGGLKN